MSRRRRGAYRKSFFTSDDLEKWLDDLWPIFQNARSRWEKGEWNSAELVAEFMVKTWQKARPLDWKNGTRKSGSEIRSGEDSPLRLLETTFLRGLPADMNDVLLDWSEGKLPLDLTFQIPSALEVLTAQTRGRRCVSVLIENQDDFLRGGEGRDSFSFALHDLIHASHFYRDPLSMRHQVFFSRWMHGFFHDPQMQSFFGDDPARLESMHYLISDMNTHIVHSLKCLKSILRDRQDLLQTALHHIPASVETDFQNHWETLNTPAESDLTRAHLSDTITQWTSSVSTKAISPKA